MSGPGDLERVDALLGLGRYADAERLLRHLLAQDPDSGRALATLAQALAGQDRWAEAVSIARRGVAAGPADASTVQVLAETLGGAGQHAEAERVARRCVSLAAATWQSHYTLAHALLRADPARPREALDQVQEALRLSPHVSGAHNLAGWSLELMRRDDEAVAAYREALRLDPTNALAMNNLAGLEARNGRLGRASRLMTAALGVDPQRALLHRSHDALLLQLARRLWVALFVAVVLLTYLVSRDAPWLLRAATGLALLTAYAVLTRRVTSQLPRGSSLWDPELLRRSSRIQRLLLLALGVLTVAVVVVSVAPHAVALAVGTSVLAGLRLVFIGFVVVSLGRVVVTFAQDQTRDRPGG